MRLLAALLLAALPSLAIAGGGPFSLLDLTYPEDPAPTAQGCTDPTAITSVCATIAE